MAKALADIANHYSRPDILRLLDDLRQSVVADNVCFREESGHTRCHPATSVFDPNLPSPSITYDHEWCSVGRITLVGHVTPVGTVSQT